ncbi:MAG: hypothetical protein CMJ78_16685 [Planctomycetaceae bacterium]|nr:hypothetical protein [Planctomycetaceae bacterium]
MATIGEVAGIPCHGDVIHAGLQHTYGYLLSTIETPFGFKRDRWVDDTISASLGLRSSALRPWTKQSLLMNVTCLGE